MLPPQMRIDPPLDKRAAGRYASRTAVVVCPATWSDSASARVLPPTRCLWHYALLSAGISRTRRKRPLLRQHTPSVRSADFHAILRVGRERLVRIHERVVRVASTIRHRDDG